MGKTWILHIGLLLVATSGTAVSAEPSTPSEPQAVELLETTVPGSSHMALSLSLDSSPTTSPLDTGTETLNNINMGLSYFWGHERRYVRLFSELRYQMNSTPSSQLFLGELENQHRTLMGLDWRAGGFIGSLYSETPLPGIRQSWSAPEINPSYNVEMGWDAGEYGRISIGARNLLDKPQPSNQLESVLDLPEAQGRVPYIRYQIDL